ncbi:MAG TPA: hypothetical protein VFM88_01750 [Vicinamibacteria bacterium]|nr:hypothetical protein [Vicinamibacteria bacterium]
MSRLSDLVSKGVRLIVTEGANETPAELLEDPEQEPAQRPTTPRVTRPREREIPPEVFDGPPPKRVAQSAVPASVADFAAVYGEAGIELPVHGYGVDKVAEMLDSKRLASLNREVKAAAVMAALEAAGVAVRDVIQDAVLRDKALDAFEAAKEREAKEARQNNEARIQSLQQELDALLQKISAEIEGLKKASEDAEKAFAALHERKLKEEERLHAIVAHFIEGADNPVTRASTTKPGPSQA